LPCRAQVMMPTAAAGSAALPPMAYLIIKTLHLLFDIAWMAAVF